MMIGVRDERLPMLCLGGWREVVELGGDLDEALTAFRLMKLPLCER